MRTKVSISDLQMALEYLANAEEDSDERAVFTRVANWMTEEIEKRVLEEAVQAAVPVLIAQGIPADEAPRLARQIARSAVKNVDTRTIK